MNRKLIPLLLCALAAALGGCRHDAPERETSVQPTQPPVLSDAGEEETETAAPQPAAVPQQGAPVMEWLKGQDAADRHVFDACGVDLGDAQGYAARLAQTFQIHIAVVVTDNLGDLDARTAAQQCYEHLYGKDSSGFLVLLNNDTGEDIVYTSGVCSLYLTDNEIAFAIAQASGSLAAGDLAAAADRLLRLGELCPTGIYDRCGLLSREQTDTVADLAAGFDGELHGVWIVETLPPSQEEDPLSAYAQERLEALGADSLLMLDISRSRCVVAYRDGYRGCSAEALTEILQGTPEYPVMTTISAYYESLE